MSPSHSILGLHHVTAITGDAQKNLDFYTGVLGLRLVKLTVNFDDPTSYHLYYGDESGAPGTIMTFFVWPGAYRGRTGTGQVAATSFSIPQWSLSFWQERLHAAGVDASTRQRRFGDELIAFHDPDGLSLEIVSSHSAKNRAGGKHSPVPHEHAIRGFHGVTVLESDFSRADVLADALGLRQIDHTGERRRFAMADGAGGGVIDVTISGGAQSGTVGAGAVHHVALRVPDDAQQVAWLEELRRRHFNVSQVMD
ncbi:MAG: VOC family protein, partial [Tepidisphaeraceae bacterium]